MYGSTEDQLLFHQQLRQENKIELTFRFVRAQATIIVGGIRRAREHNIWVQIIDVPSGLQKHELQSSGTLLLGSQIISLFLINSDRAEKIDATDASSKTGVASIKNKKKSIKP